jgi:ribosomal protein S13
MLTFIYGIGKFKSLIIAAKLGFAFPIFANNLNNFRLRRAANLILNCVDERLKIRRVEEVNIQTLIQTGILWV